MAKTRMNAKARRRNILDAALKVISESNYYEATTAKIAAAAGITEPTIYLHFKSKQRLFIELLEDIRCFVVDRFNELINEGDDPISKVHNLARAHYEFIVQHGHGERFKVLVMATAVNDEKVRKKLAQIFFDLRNFFGEQVKEAHSMGILRNDVNNQAVSLLLLSWIGLLGTLQAVGLGKALAQPDFERVMDMIMDMMDEGLRKK